MCFIESSVHAKGPLAGPLCKGKRFVNLWTPRVLWSGFQHYPPACGPRFSACLRAFPFGFHHVPNLCRLVKEWRVSYHRALLGFSITVSFRGCSWELPHYDDFQTTLADLRSLSASVPRAEERHLFTHDWSRLLLLFEEWI